MINKNMAVEAKVRKCAYKLQRSLISNFEDKKIYEEFIVEYKSLNPDERREVANDTVEFLLKAGFDSMLPQAESIFTALNSEEYTNVK